MAAKYRLELKRVQDSFATGRRNGATFQSVPTHKQKDVVAVWQFGTSDSDATTVAGIEVAVAALTAAAFAG